MSPPKPKRVYGPPVQSGRARRGNGLTRGVGRLGLGAGRIVLRPTRAVAGDVFEPVAEAAVDRALSGPLPEAIAHSLVDHHVIERIVREVLARRDLAELSQAVDDEALERMVERVLANPRTERVIGETLERALASQALQRVMASPEFEQLLARTMSSPAVRGAILAGTESVGDELVDSTRASLMRGDARIDLRRSKADAQYAGVVSRGAALALDALLTNAVFLLGVAMLALVSSLAGGFHRGWVLDSLAVCGWLVVQTVYFTGYWSAAGRTPGMHADGRSRP